jgi:hypothetical protein
MDGAAGYDVEPMDATEKINSAWQRSVRGLTRRPEVGKVTHSVTARMTDGLTCAVQADGHRVLAVRVDSPAATEAVVDVLDRVDTHSPLTNILRRPVELCLTVTRAADA